MKSERFELRLTIDGAVIEDTLTKENVLTLHPQYKNIICLETNRPDDHPFTTLCEWMNGLSNEALESEGIPCAS